MAEARSHEHWNHTAALLALIANVHRDPRARRAYAPADFLPQRPEAARAASLRTRPITDLSILKSVFIDCVLPR